MAPPLCPESCVEPQLPHVCPPPAMNSAHTHSRCRGAPCPHHMFSHLPFLLCSEPQNISSTIFPSVHLSSLSFSFSLLPSLLPPSLSGTPCGSSHPVPRSTPTVPLYPGHDEAAVPAAPLTMPCIPGGHLGSIALADLPHDPQYSGPAPVLQSQEGNRGLHSKHLPQVTPGVGGV